jgi:flagellar motor switch protein FliG
MTDISKLSGPERAAILLMALGEDDAAAILRHMNPHEVQKVGTCMATLANVTKEQVTAVLEEFIQQAENETALGVGSEEYVRKVLVAALGEEKAGGIIDRILVGHNTKGIEALKWMDARAVADLIRLEHPQIIAIVLSFLERDQAAAVLASLPARERPGILMRIARLDGIQPSALQELDRILQRQLSGSANLKSASVGGINTAAEILNFIDGSQEAEIMDWINDVDADLGHEIQDKMFGFHNLVDVDDRSIQSLLRQTSSENLILALKGADEAVREKIFRNMSKRAGEMLRDDLEAKGPVRLFEVEAAQKEILEIARRMADAGELVLSSKAEQYV